MILTAFGTNERPITIENEIFLLTQEKLIGECLNNYKRKKMFAVSSDKKKAEKRKETYE